MSLKIYNTLKGKKEEFTPLNGNKVTMYVCGPTVYALSHIGHARSAVNFDAVFRYLIHSGLDVTYTRNYTDIDDKIINKANEEGVSSKDLAERYITAYDEDMEALGVRLPTIRPRATESIETIIKLISTLIEKNFAYDVSGDVFYRVRKLPDYGKLSGKKIEDLISGARVDIDDKKEDPLDFALWKSSKPGEPSWKSPWGEGRPGWHIECSAMCLEWLGETIDIHGGGKDLIFPHHENEVAQSEAATGKPFARFWIHNGFVNMEKEKMSKSLGNILNIRDVLQAHTPESIRLFLLSSHYRSPIEYGPHTLAEAEARAERIYRMLKRIDEILHDNTDAAPDAEALKLRMQPITAAMDDDFNTAKAIGVLFEEAARANRLMDDMGETKDAESMSELALIRAIFKASAEFLGLFGMKPEDYFSLIKSRAALSAEEIEALIEERKEARANKDFKRGDEIRDELSEKGIILEDTAKGTLWTVKG
jgi:cysteinyl-tRNA synthetase